MDTVGGAVTVPTIVAANHQTTTAINVNQGNSSSNNQHSHTTNHAHGVGAGIGVGNNSSLINSSLTINSNSSSSSSSSSSASSGYGSTSATPTNSYETHTAATTPVAIAEPIIPIATVAAVSPYYSESLTTQALEGQHHYTQQQQQQQQQQQHQHHHQQQQQQHQQLLNTHQQHPSQTHLQTHQLQQNLHHTQRQQYYSSPYDYQQQQQPQQQQQQQQQYPQQQSHNLSLTYNMGSGLPALDGITSSNSSSSAGVAELTSSYQAMGHYKSTDMSAISYERSNTGRSAATHSYHQSIQQQQHLPNEAANKHLSHSQSHQQQQFLGTSSSSSKSRSSSSLLGSSSSSLLGSSSLATSSSATTKPQATATPFYAQPIVQQSNNSSSFYDNLKHKMPLDYHDNFVNFPNAAAYHQQQKYYAAAKSQLKEASSYGTPPGLTGKSLYPNANSYFPGATGQHTGSGYDKYMYSSAYPSLAYETPPDPAYRKGSTTGSINSHSWPWGIDYASGNSRTIPPPTGHIPTATVAPTHASYLAANTSHLTRDPYYMGHEKYAMKYDKYPAPYQQTYVSPTGSRHHLWPGTHAALSERLPPPPTHSLHTTPYYAANTASSLNARQACCSQPYQPQSCYYPPTRLPPHGQAHTLPQSTAYMSASQSSSHPHQPHLNPLSSSCKYGSVIDYGTTSKLKNPNDLYLSAHYDSNPPSAPAPVPPASHLSHSYSHNYGTMASAAVNPHYNPNQLHHGAQPAGPLITHETLPTTPNYTNDLSVSSNAFDSYLHPDPAAQLNPQGPAGPTYGQVNAKRALLDYRKPAHHSTTSVPPLPTVQEECYQPAGQNITSTGAILYQAADLLNTPETTTFPEYEGQATGYTAEPSSQSLEEKTTDETTKNLSLRDFISSWNDDEEDYAANEETNFDQNAVISEVLKANPVTHPEVESELQAQPQLPAQPEETPLATEEKCNEVNILNKAAEVITAKALPSSDMDASQYANLPDIVIDIEKSNVPPAISTPPQQESNNSMLDNFDVEKELDQLQMRKNESDAIIMKPNQDITATKDIKTDDIVAKVKDSVELPKTSPMALDNFNLEQQLKTLPPRHAAEVSDGSAQMIKSPRDYEGYESGSSRQSNESSLFEKEYETFINKITNKPSSKSESEFEEKVKEFSKFYKRKRKLKESEVNSQPETKEEDGKKLKSSECEEKGKSSNFPQVYTRKSRYRQASMAQRLKLMHQVRQRRPLSTYYKLMHSLKRYRRYRSKKVRDYVADLKEKHLPLIKRQSIKNYSIEVSPKTLPLFNPQSLKSLVLSIINSEEFRECEFMNLPMEVCVEAEEKHICTDPSCETCEVIRSLMEPEEFVGAVVPEASFVSSTVASAGELVFLEEQVESLSEIDARLIGDQILIPIDSTTNVEGETLYPIPIEAKVLEASLEEGCTEEILFTKNDAEELMEVDDLTVPQNICGLVSVLKSTKQNQNESEILPEDKQRLDLNEEISSVIQTTFANSAEVQDAASSLMENASSLEALKEVKQDQTCQDMLSSEIVAETASVIQKTPTLTNELKNIEGHSEKSENQDDLKRKYSTESLSSTQDNSKNLDRNLEKNTENLESPKLPESSLSSKEFGLKSIKSEPGSESESDTDSESSECDSNCSCSSSSSSESSDEDEKNIKTSKQKSKENLDVTRSVVKENLKRKSSKDEAEGCVKVLILNRVEEEKSCQLEEDQRKEHPKILQETEYSNSSKIMQPFPISAKNEGDSTERDIKTPTENQTKIEICKKREEPVESESSSESSDSESDDDSRRDSSESEAEMETATTTKLGNEKTNEVQDNDKNFNEVLNRTKETSELEIPAIDETCPDVCEGVFLNKSRVEENNTPIIPKSTTILLEQRQIKDTEKVTTSIDRDAMNDVSQDSYQSIKNTNERSYDPAIPEASRVTTPTSYHGEDLRTHLHTPDFHNMEPLDYSTSRDDFSKEKLMEKEDEIICISEDSSSSDTFQEDKMHSMPPARPRIILSIKRTPEVIETTKDNSLSKESDAEKYCYTTKFKNSNFSHDISDQSQSSFGTEHEPVEETEEEYELKEAQRSHIYTKEHSISSREFNILNLSEIDERMGDLFPQTSFARSSPVFDVPEESRTSAKSDECKSVEANVQTFKNTDFIPHQSVHSEKSNCIENQIVVKDVTADNDSTEFKTKALNEHSQNSWNIDDDDSRLSRDLRVTQNFDTKEVQSFANFRSSLSPQFSGCKSFETVSNPKEHIEYPQDTISGEKDNKKMESPHENSEVLEANTKESSPNNNAKNLNSNMETPKSSNVTLDLQSQKILQAFKDNHHYPENSLGSATSNEDQMNNKFFSKSHSDEEQPIGSMSNRVSVISYSHSNTEVSDVHSNEEVNTTPESTDKSLDSYPESIHSISTTAENSDTEQEVHESGPLNFHSIFGNLEKFVGDNKKLAKQKTALSTTSTEIKDSEADEVSKVPLKSANANEMETMSLDSECSVSDDESIKENISVPALKENEIETQDTTIASKILGTTSVIVSSISPQIPEKESKFQSPVNIREENENKKGIENEIETMTETCAVLPEKVLCHQIPSSDRQNEGIESDEETSNSSSDEENQKLKRGHPKICTSSPEKCNAYDEEESSKSSFEEDNDAFLDVDKNILNSSPVKNDTNEISFKQTDNVILQDSSISHDTFRNLGVKSNVEEEEADETESFHIQRAQLPIIEKNKLNFEADIDNQTLENPRCDSANSIQIPFETNLTNTSHLPEETFVSHQTVTQIPSNLLEENAVEPFQILNSEEAIKRKSVEASEPQQLSPLSPSETNACSENFDTESMKDSKTNNFSTAKSPVKSVAYKSGKVFVEKSPSPSVSSEEILDAMEATTDSNSSESDNEEVNPEENLSRILHAGEVNSSKYLAEKNLSVPESPLTPTETCCFEDFEMPSKNPCNSPLSTLIAVATSLAKQTTITNSEDNELPLISPRYSPPNALITDDFLMSTDRPAQSITSPQYTAEKHDKEEIVHKENEIFSFDRETFEESIGPQKSPSLSPQLLKAVENEDILSEKSMEDTPIQSSPKETAGLSSNEEATQDKLNENNPENAAESEVYENEVEVHQVSKNEVELQEVITENTNECRENKCEDDNFENFVKSNEDLIISERLVEVQKQVLENFEKPNEHLNLEEDKISSNETLNITETALNAYDPENIFEQITESYTDEHSKSSKSDSVFDERTEILFDAIRLDMQKDQSNFSNETCNETSFNAVSPQTSVNFRDCKEINNEDEHADLSQTQFNRNQIPSSSAITEYEENMKLTTNVREFRNSTEALKATEIGVGSGLYETIEELPVYPSYGRFKSYRSRKFKNSKKFDNNKNLKSNEKTTCYSRTESPNIDEQQNLIEQRIALESVVASPRKSNDMCSPKDAVEIENSVLDNENSTEINLTETQINLKPADLQKEEKTYTTSPVPEDAHDMPQELLTFPNSPNFVKSPLSLMDLRKSPLNITPNISRENKEPLLQLSDKLQSSSEQENNSVFIHATSPMSENSHDISQGVLTFPSSPTSAKNPSPLVDFTESPSNISSQAATDNIEPTLPISDRLQSSFDQEDDSVLVHAKSPVQEDTHDVSLHLVTFPNSPNSAKSPSPLLNLRKSPLNIPSKTATEYKEALHQVSDKLQSSCDQHEGSVFVYDTSSASEYKKNVSPDIVTFPNSPSSTKSPSPLLDLKESPLNIASKTSREDKEPLHQVSDKLQSSSDHNEGSVCVYETSSASEYKNNVSPDIVTFPNSPSSAKSPSPLLDLKKSPLNITSKTSREDKEPLHQISDKLQSSSDQEEGSALIHATSPMPEYKNDVSPDMATFPNSTNSAKSPSPLLNLRESSASISSKISTDNKEPLHQISDRIKSGSESPVSEKSLSLKNATEDIEDTLQISEKSTAVSPVSENTLESLNLQTNSKFMAEETCDYHALEPGLTELLKHPDLQSLAIQHQTSFEDESGSGFHGFVDQNEEDRIRYEIENLKDDTAANDAFPPDMNFDDKTSNHSGSLSSDLNELEALEKEISQHCLVRARDDLEDLNNEDEEEEAKKNLVSVAEISISKNDIEHIKQMLQSDEENGESEEQIENEQIAEVKENSSLVKLPKLSDLCRLALNDSSALECRDNEILPPIIERELSVEEALAEMYRQAGVLLSDPEDNENDKSSITNEEAQDVLLINLQEILNNDNDNVYVLQCDMNVNVQEVNQNQDQGDENHDNKANDNDKTQDKTKNDTNTMERVNTTVQLIGILNTDSDTPEIHIISSDSESEVIILSDCDTDVEFHAEPFSPPVPSAAAAAAFSQPRTTSTSSLLSCSREYIPFIDDFESNDDSESDLSTIHHEEIVPDNLNKYLKEEFYRYLHEKYAQKKLSKYYHANRILRKYKKRYCKKYRQ